MVSITSGSSMEDRIILALKPKIDELDRKVLAGESLGSDDINTLLLQHQFNHIYHLELRMGTMDERMDGQDSRMDRIETDISGIRVEMVSMDGRLNHQMATLRGELKSEMSDLRGELMAAMADLKTYVEKGINRNMLFYFGSFAALIAVLQLIDRLVPRS